MLAEHRRDGVRCERSRREASCGDGCEWGRRRRDIQECFDAKVRDNRDVEFAIAVEIRNSYGEGAANDREV
jgi:hypothetical protein